MGGRDGTSRCFHETHGAADRVRGLPERVRAAGGRRGGGRAVMLVGQAPGPHEADSRRPFAYTAGRRLFSWMADLGVDEETFRQRVHIAAVIRCFPGKDAKSGGDRVPDEAEIARCGAHLDREIIDPEAEAGDRRRERWRRSS